MRSGLNRAYRGEESKKEQGRAVGSKAEQDRREPSRSNHGVVRLESVECGE